MESQTKKIRLKHNRNLPFNGIDIKPFPEAIFAYKEAKEMDNQELGIALKKYDCPNVFQVIFERLWKDVKYQGTSIMKSETLAYESFMNDMYIYIRGKISEWDETKKSGFFFGWAKTTIYRTFLCSIRLNFYKTNKTKSTSDLGEFTNSSIFDFQNNQYDEIEDFENEDEKNKNDLELKLNKQLSFLSIEDRNILWDVIVNKESIKSVADKNNTDPNKINIRINKLKKQLRKELA